MHPWAWVGLLWDSSLAFNSVKGKTLLNLLVSHILIARSGMSSILLTWLVLYKILDIDLKTRYGCLLWVQNFLYHIYYKNPANERWCYNVTLSLIGWAHTQNDPRPCSYAWENFQGPLIIFHGMYLWYFENIRLLSISSRDPSPTIDSTCYYYYWQLRDRHGHSHMLPAHYLAMVNLNMGSGALTVWRAWWMGY